MREAISWSVAPKNRLYIWESWQSFPNIRIRFLRQSELQSVLQLHPCWSRNFSVILSVYVRLQLSCVKPHSHLRIFYVRAYMKLWLQIKATSRHTIVKFCVSASGQIVSCVKFCSHLRIFVRKGLHEVVTPNKGNFKTYNRCFQNGVC